MPQKLQRWLRKWLDVSLNSKCLLLISLPAAATVLMAGAAYILTLRISIGVEQANRSLRTVQEIQRLRLADTETSADVRAYFITGEDAFAIRTRSSLAAFDSARLQLLNLTAGVPFQQQCLAEIGSIQNGREEQMFGATERFRSGILSREQLRAELSTAEERRRQMEKLVQAMEYDNAGRAQIELGRTEALRAQQASITGICLCLGLFGCASMTFLFWRGITKRIDRLQRNLARLLSGALPEPLAGRDEIGALNEGLSQVADALRRKDLALENALHGIAEINSDGGYLWMNKIYATAAECSQTRGPANILATVQAEDRARVADAIAQMRLSGRAEVAARIERNDGPVSNVGFTFLAVAEDPDSSFYVFLRDIWMGKKADVALIRAKDAALASNRAKTEFLARVSHDIRTPLNAILGSADLLSQTPLSFDQGEYVSMFQRNCRRLLRLINDFLDFSRIEAGALRLDRVPFRIRDMVADAVATFGEPAACKGLRLGIEIDPAAPEWALGDASRIQQILTNLLSNALKFTSVGRLDVTVKVVSAASDIDKLRFEVSDSGLGIALEDQDKIFVRFVQLENQTPGQRGTGLGLAICRDLVELMGGTIGVVSREGSGSTFHFSLPLEAVESIPAVPGATESGLAQLPPGEPIRVLVAEDTEDNRLLLEHYLRDEPVKLRMAINGQEALDAVEQGEQFDLILMDIDMPVMDGYIATRRIRAWQQSQALLTPLVPTPIVALSADAMIEAVRACMDAGCVAHVAKPMDRETLLKTIRCFAASRVASGEQPARTVKVSSEVMALVPQYLAAKGKQIEEARVALVSRDFGPIRRFGHNLKGTGRGYGFPPIEELGREIERAAAQADENRISAQLDALHRFVTESATMLAKP